MVVGVEVGWDDDEEERKKREREGGGRGRVEISTAGRTTHMSTF